MDYTEAELEARIFPSVDLDPRDWEEDFEEQECDEPHEDESWMDADALASAGFGTDEDYGGYGGDDY